MYSFDYNIIYITKHFIVGRKGYGLLIWMDELTLEWIPKSNSGSGQIEAKMEEMKRSIEEMRLEIRRLRESLERKNRGSKRENRVAYIFVIVLFFVAYIWCVKNGRDGLLELM